MTEINLRHSLRSQIAAVFIGAMLCSVLILFAVNGLFLERYYVTRKVERLLEARQYLETLDLSEPYNENYFLRGGRSYLEDDHSLSDDIRSNSSTGNLSWVIVSRENQLMSYYGSNTFLLQDMLFGYIYNLNTLRGDDKILDVSESYILQQTHDRILESDFLEIWGTLSEEYYFLIRTPLESIRESADISNRFYIITGLIVALLSGMLLWILTKQITRPISELADLSLKMSDLEFEARYKSHAGNEIDVLGENFNRMSSQLEKTISELKFANHELEKDIQDRIKIDEMRKEFLDNVSHELKTPIALIQGYAEGLKENITDDPESMDFYCEVIMDEAQKMNKLVKNLLLLNQLESGKDAAMMERFDLVSLIRGVISKMDILIRQKEASLLFSEDEAIYVWADEFMTEQVVTNYLSNAIHHLENEMQIEIRVIREGRRVRVSVFNTGQPIPEQDLPKLWDKFYKVDKARTREYGGSGIGLSIVKAILDGMNQEYGVRNYDNGVAFYFTLECK